MTQINFIKLAEIVSSYWVDNVEHPNWEKWEENPNIYWKPQKLEYNIIPAGLGKYAPFGIIIGINNASELNCLENNMPEGYKIIYKSKPAVNNYHTHSGDPKPRQTLIIVDKV